MSDVKQAAIGKWPGILAALGVDESFLTKKNGPCPFCGGKDRWRFTDHEGRGMWICNHCGKGDGFDLLMRLNGWDFKTAAQAVQRVLGSVPEEREGRSSKRNAPRRIERIKRGLIAEHSEVSAYLRARGLRQPPGVRAHPSLAYYEDRQRVADYPAMVAPVQSPAGEIVSLHVTYVSGGAKAPVSAPRRLLTPIGSLDGSAIRLWPRAEHMGVAEGIETAIAAATLFSIPVWSVLNTTLMEKWQPPKGVKRVTICADHDANFAGHKAAYTLAFRLANAGLEVDVRVPDEVGDWNDVLMNGSGRTGTTNSVAASASAQRVCATAGASLHG